MVWKILNFLVQIMLKMLNYLLLWYCQIPTSTKNKYFPALICFKPQFHTIKCIVRLRWWTERYAFSHFINSRYIEVALCSSSLHNCLRMEKPRYLLKRLIHFGIFWCWVLTVVITVFLFLYIWFIIHVLG